MFILQQLISSGKDSDIYLAVRGVFTYTNSSLKKPRILSQKSEGNQWSKSILIEHFVFKRLAEAFINSIHVIEYPS